MAIEGTAPPDSVLGLIDQALQAPRTRMMFPPVLEARFEADTVAGQIRHLRIAGWIGAFLYIGFLVSDVRMIPDVIRLAVTVRFAVVAMGLVLVYGVLRPQVAPLARAIAASCPGLLAVAGLVVLFLATRSPDQEAYVSGTVVILLFGTVCVQGRFAVVLASTLASATIIAAGLLASPLSIPARDSQLAVTFSVAALTLMTSYRMERQQRRDYLVGLRETLRNAELSANNDRLRILSERDGLTGLLNRRALDACFVDGLAAGARTGAPLGVMMLDVDWFKAFNDRYGHQAGDDCLRQVAATLREQMRGDLDHVGRFGGEEFLALLPGQDLTGCIRIAERVRRAIEQAQILHEAAAGPWRVVTASLGVASAMPDEQATMGTLIKAADHNLYAAKQAGRNRVFPPLAAPIGSDAAEAARPTERAAG